MLLLLTEARFIKDRQQVKRLSAVRETWVRSLGREDSPGEGNGNPLQYSCPGQRSLVGYSPWGHKESDTTETSLSDINYFKKMKSQL